MKSIPTRREFAQALAVLGVAATPAASQDKVLIPDIKSYAAALETTVRFRFGRQLTEEQIKKVQALLFRQRFAGNLLNRVEIENGDDPIVAFRADLP